MLVSPIYQSCSFFFKIVQRGGGRAVWSLGDNDATNHRLLDFVQITLPPPKKEKKGRENTAKNQFWYSRSSQNNLTTHTAAFCLPYLATRHLDTIKRKMKQEKHGSERTSFFPTIPSQAWMNTLIMMTLPARKMYTGLCRRRTGLVWEYSRGTEKSGFQEPTKQLENLCF